VKQGNPSAAIAELCRERSARNRELLASLREDAHAKELLQACEADQTLGRSADVLLCLCAPALVFLCL